MNQNLDGATREKIETLIGGHDIVLFMKGNALMPLCGFSSAAVDFIKKCGFKPSEIKTVNILENEEIRQGLKMYSNWPTFPQLYVRQEFIGGADIMRDMFESGELQTLLKP